MKVNLNKLLLSSLVIVLSFFFIYSVFAVGPSGGSVGQINTSTAQADAAGSNGAQAGNVTELNINGYTTTQTWQGYFGNVTGTIQLADLSDNVLYNWSLASPEGEIYASTNSSISWNNIQCFNFTANQTYGSESGSGGLTSLQGTNLTTLENMFNIVYDDVDGVDETFTLFGAGTHDLFYTSNKQFSEGECRSTRVYGASGTGINNQFEEVLLYEPVTTSIVFATILDNDLSGFDSRLHDFEMLVLEDGHGTNTASTQYYFYVELQ